MQDDYFKHVLCFCDLDAAVRCLTVILVSNTRVLRHTVDSTRYLPLGVLATSQPHQIGRFQCRTRERVWSADLEPRELPSQPSFRHPLTCST